MHFGLDEPASLDLIGEGFEFGVLLFDEGVFLQEVSLILGVAEFDLVFLLNKGELCCLEVLLQNGQDVMVDLLALDPALELALVKATLHERGQGVSGVDVVSKVSFRFGHGLFHPDLQVLEVDRFTQDFCLLKKLLVQLVDPILVICLLNRQLSVKLDAARALTLVAFVCCDVKIIQLSEVFRTGHIRNGETFGILLLREA